MVSQQEKTALLATQQHPTDPSAWASLVTARWTSAGQGDNYNSTTGAFSGNVTVATVNSVPVAVGQGSPATVPGFYCGVGVPTFSAANASKYLRFDGTTGSTWYANTSGASTAGTTWSAQLTP